MPPPALSSRRAVPPSAATSLATMARPNPLPPSDFSPGSACQKPVERPGPLGRGQPRTVVHDMDRRASSPRFGRQRDRRSRRGHVEGVGDVVVEHLRQAVGVGHHGGARGHRDLEGHRPLLGEGSPALGARHKERADLEPSAGHRLGASVGAGQREQTVDEAGQPLGLARPRPAGPRRRRRRHRPGGSPAAAAAR